jgi:hypothetical protein
MVLANGIFFGIFGELFCSFGVILWQFRERKVPFSGKSLIIAVLQI